MSIQNAMWFFEIYRKEELLRQCLGDMDSPDEVRNFLCELDMEFTDGEFEEAYNLQSVKCQDEAEHNILNQIKFSYMMLVSVNEN